MILEHQASTTPLLSTFLQQTRPNDSLLDIQQSPPPQHSQRSHHRNQSSFYLIPRLRQLITQLKPYSVLWLAALSILESIIVAQVGKVAGSFYQIIVDEQSAALLYAMIHAAVLYIAYSAISTFSVYLSGLFSLRWRKHLATVLHRDLCKNHAFAALPSHIDNPDQRSSTELALLCDSLGNMARLIAGVPFKIAYYSYLSHAYIGFFGVCAAYTFFWLGTWLQQTTTSPLARAVAVQEKKEGNLRSSHTRLREHGNEIAAYRGGRAELVHLNAVLSYALINQSRVIALKAAVAATTKASEYTGALLNYALVAAAVFAGHASSSIPGVGDTTGGEKAQFVSNASFFTLSLIYSLTEVLDVADAVSTVAALIMRTSEMFEALQGTAHALDEIKHRDGQQGEVVLIPGAGTRETLSSTKITAHARFPGASHEHPGSIASSSASAAASAAALTPTPTTMTPSSVELKPSQLATMILPPSIVFFHGGKSMEISLHQLGIDLCKEVEEIFPDIQGVHSIHTETMSPDARGEHHQRGAGGPRSLPMNGASPNTQRGILCCMVIQFAGNGTIDLSPDRSSATLDIASAEMDRLLDIFLEFEHAVNAALSSKGYWCNAVDPRTGTALHGKQGNRWSEVAAAHALLRYDTHDAGVCPLLVHPVHGTSAYPVSLFTNAPKDVFLFVLSSLSDSEIPDSDSAPGMQQTSPVHQTLNPTASSCYLSLRNLSIATPDASRLLIRSLSLDISPQHHVLLTGPNGAGKSTLLRTLCYLHPLLSGSFSWNSDLHQQGIQNDSTLVYKCVLDDPSCVMYIPQRTLLAPGNTLRQQLAYPLPPQHHQNDASVYLDVLHKVGLSSLLTRCSNNIDAPLFGSTIDEIGNALDDTTREIISCIQEASALSPGELQRLAVARVLLHRPRVVLLDEATSSMDEEASMQLYNEIQRAGVTCVSVAQECGGMKAVHRVHVRVDGSGDDGGWTVSKIPRL